MTRNITTFSFFSFTYFWRMTRNIASLNLLLLLGSSSSISTAVTPAVCVSSFTSSRFQQMKKARLTEIKLKLKTSCVKYLFQTEYLWMFDLYLDEMSSLKVRTWTKKGKFRSSDH